MAVRVVIYFLLATMLAVTGAAAGDWASAGSAALVALLLAWAITPLRLGPERFLSLAAATRTVGALVGVAGGFTLYRWWIDGEFPLLLGLITFVATVRLMTLADVWLWIRSRSDEDRA